MELLYHCFVHLGRSIRREALMLKFSWRPQPAQSEWMHAGFVAAALFLLYAITAPRSVALEDDGLFILSGYFLGIEHPPGFPLHTLLAKLFTFLPFGTVAYRVHLLSALFGALSCGLLWMCARTVFETRVPAYIAAFGLGLSPAFWSQALIAEVYTLNTFFFLLLVMLGLRRDARLLPWMALAFGLSLSNHWPLMLLAAPAFAVLLWPMRVELARRAGLLSWLVILGLAPYAWMVYRSWKALPVSFYGPLETLPEIWFFLSRAGYAYVDASPTAGWLDRVRFLQFFGGELVLQFALMGALLAAVGFVAQWRRLGRPTAAFLTIAFLMPSVVLLLLLRFDYDALSKHVFHVYPLPAYAVAALWMALGFAQLAERRPVLQGARGAAAGAALLALVAVVGARTNLMTSADWASRYAHAVLDSLPKDAVLFPQGDTDLPPIAYLHLVENVRPDVKLYEGKGLILGNRLFHFLRTNPADAEVKVKDFIADESNPVAFSMQPQEGYARRDRWLHSEIDKSSTEAGRITVDVPEEAVRFFEEAVLHPGDEPHAWVAYHRNELRQRYALLLARRLTRAQAPDERTGRHLGVLSEDFHGALGLAEGLLANPEGYPGAVVNDLLIRAAERMPSDVRKADRSKFFYLRAALRLGGNDPAGAIADLETSVALWPARENRAVRALEDVRRTTVGKPL
jgi:hypothetical protein